MVYHRYTIDCVHNVHDNNYFDSLPLKELTHVVRQ